MEIEYVLSYPAKPIYRVGQSVFFLEGITPQVYPTYETCKDWDFCFPRGTIARILSSNTGRGYLPTYTVEVTDGRLEEIWVVGSKHIRGGVSIKGIPEYLLTSHSLEQERYIYR